MTDPRIIFPRAPESSRHFSRYAKLILSRPKRGLIKEPGFHIHHILPLCMDGSDFPDNLIKLTYREHYLAHALLCLSFPSLKKLGKPINCFKSSAKNSRVYEKLARHEHSLETRKKIGESNKGKPRPRRIPMSDQERKERAERARNREWSEESKEKLRKKALANPTIDFALKAANSPDRDRTGGNNPRANKEVWLNYDYLKSVWLENGKCGPRKLFSLTEVGRSFLSLRVIIEKFKEEQEIV